MQLPPVTMLDHIEVGTHQVAGRRQGNSQHGRLYAPSRKSWGLGYEERAHPSTPSP